MPLSPLLSWTGLFITAKLFPCQAILTASLTENLSLVDLYILWRIFFVHFLANCCMFYLTFYIALIPKYNSIIGGQSFLFSGIKIPPRRSGAVNYHIEESRPDFSKRLSKQQYFGGCAPSHISFDPKGAQQHILYFKGSQILQTYVGADRLHLSSSFPVKYIICFTTPNCQW